jgi:hypothetical protein
MYSSQRGNHLSRERQIMKITHASFKKIINQTVEVVQQIETQSCVSPELSHALESLLIKVKLLSDNVITRQLTFFIESLLLASYKDDVLSIDSAIKFERLLLNVKFKERLCQIDYRNLDSIEIFEEALFNIRIDRMLTGENVYHVKQDGHDSVLCKNGTPVYYSTYISSMIDLLIEYKSHNSTSTL